MANDKSQAANWAISRVRWAGEPRCSYADLVDLLAISTKAIGPRDVKDGWSKKLDMSNIVDKAHAVADRKIASKAAVPSKRKGKVDDFLDPGALAQTLSPASAVIPAVIPDSKNAACADGRMPRWKLGRDRSVPAPFLAAIGYLILGKVSAHRTCGPAGLSWFGLV